MRPPDAAFLGGDLIPPSQKCFISGQVDDSMEAESLIGSDAASGRGK